MKRDIERFKQGFYDVLVIGGGINGAAIAHMAALNGLKVALLEKDDFASGTSSKSTKIVHGGLRYLENFEFGLVREALSERHRQLESAPHLVKPLGFIIPVYKGDKRPFWLMRFGVFLYDLLSGKRRINKRRLLTKQEIFHFSPDIKKDNLVGGVMYYDAQMDDARLVLENVLSASEKGAHVANYVEAKAFIKKNGKAVGVMAYDRLADKTFEVHAQKIVCAVGPWTDIFIAKERSEAPQQVRTTKGVHIVYRKVFCDHALLIPAQNDGRVIFIIPWRGHSLIGTTDTDYDGSADSVQVGEADVEYLFREARRFFPEENFSKEHIITAFAGLRPLSFKAGAPSKVSRRHAIKEFYSGVIYAIGGKYTTYRKIAEDVLRLVTKKELVETKQGYCLYGSGKILERPEEIAQEHHLDSDIITELLDMYGVRYKDVLKLAAEDKKFKRRLYPGSKRIDAQIVYAKDVEMARTVEDVIERRLGLIYEDTDPKNYMRKIKDYMAG